MFGYILADKPELKIREFYEYRSYYCGLCKILKKDYGISAQLCLNYDMVFLILILTGLYEPVEKKEKHICIASPIRHEFIINDFTYYCADMLVMAAYFKAIDDVEDEKKLYSRFLAGVLKPSSKKIQKKYPIKFNKISNLLDRLKKAEKDNSPLEKVSSISAEVQSEIFSYKDDIWNENLRKLGEYIGKFLYILDAYDDVEKDIKSGNFNPLKKDFENLNLIDFENKYKNYLQYNIAKAAEEIEILPIEKNSGIVRNIIYSGVWGKFNLISERRKKENERSL